MSKVQTLTKLIKIAISKHDIAKLYELKHICDMIHQTGEPFSGYSPEDLPSDALYEEMVRLIETSASDIVESTVAEQTANPDVKHRHQKLISDMWMGSITKDTEILEIPDALLLPKFDGCSCGVKLKRYTAGGKFELIEALTRGTAEGYTQNRSNITEKFAMIAEPLIKALNSSTASNFKFNNQQPPFANVLQITLRGEIVLKDRETASTAPASIVAGKINGHMTVWVNSLSSIEFIPYEIMRLNYDLTDYYNYYVPTQTETLNMFNTLKLTNFPIINHNLNADELEFVQAHFQRLLETIPQPLDGVVYCSSSWRYPVLNEQTKPKQYGKYAWKPSSEATTTLRSVSYSLARDGKFTFMLSYDPVKINGKNYRNAKTATSRLLALSGIGIGSVITVKLAGDISPMIVDFINETDDIEPLTLPTKCPFCKTKTKLRKGKTPTLICLNPSCPEIMKQKMLNFLKTLHIKGIAEAKLSALEHISLENVINEYLEPELMRNKFSNIDTRTFLVALGVGGAQAVSKRIKQHSHMNQLTNIKTNFDEICELLDEEIESDPFIEETLNYLSDLIL